MNFYSKIAFIYIYIYRLFNNYFNIKNLIDFFLINLYCNVILVNFCFLKLNILYDMRLVLGHQLPE